MWRNTKNPPLLARAARRSREGQRSPPRGLPGKTRGQDHRACADHPGQETARATRPGAADDFRIGKSRAKPESMFVAGVGHTFGRGKDRLEISKRIVDFLENNSARGWNDRGLRPPIPGAHLIFVHDDCSTRVAALEPAKAWPWSATLSSTPRHLRLDPASDPSS